MSGARGEATIQTDDGEVEVLFTNRALATAEKFLGRSIIGIAQGFVDGGSGITEVVRLLQVGMEAARRDARSGSRAVTLNDAFAVLKQAGFAAVAAAMMEAVAAVLSYGQEEADPNA